MATHEDLATLFSRNLSLNPCVAPKEEPKPETPIVYSISQHYHHSAHLATQQQQPSRPASEPPQTDQLTTEIILSRHGVDAASLFPSQLELFKSADASQQMRLIELWRICPPNYGGAALTQDLWSQTNFQQEEAMAKLRYERQMLEERMSRAGGDQGMDTEDTMSDESSTAAMPLTPIQGGDSRWVNPEPYMASGYEALAQREYEQSAGPSKDIYSHFGTGVGGQTYNHSTDPVYKTIEDIHKFPNVGGNWQRLVEQRQQAMENQYGTFEQFQHTQGEFKAHGQDEDML